MGIRAQLAALFVLSIGVVFAFGAVGCGARSHGKAEPRGVLRFTGSPKTASIEVDEHNVGPLQMFLEHGLLLRAGPHRVIARAPGYFTEYFIVDITADRVHVLKVRLREIPQ